MTHPDFDALTLSLGADAAGRRLRRQHRQGLPECRPQPRRLAGRALPRRWPGRAGPSARARLAGISPGDAIQQHCPRVVCGVRHFCRWLQAEGESDRDATAGIRTAAPGDPATPVLSDEELRRLLATCTGREFTARRDTAIMMLFLDGGLRLAELADLQVADVDLRDRIVYVAGKASRRSGPRHRAVPVGVKAPGRWTATCGSVGGTRMRKRRGCGSAAAAGRS
jgi:hypothetical protein